MSSPFVVIGSFVVVFFSCILWATRGSARSHQPHGQEQGKHYY